MNLPTYICHKRVKAAPIIFVMPTLDAIVVENGHPDGLRISVDPKLFARGVAAEGDYFVVYEDGYQSWSPKKAFEDGYHLDGDN